MASRSLLHKFRLRELKKALPPAASSSAVSVTNPFLPYLNPETKRWAPPRYSLRRQAELIKRARLEGALHLLPPGPKLKPNEVLAAQLKHNIAGEKGKEKASESPLIVDITTPIEWVGEVKVREPAGFNVGNRLYAAKKQMFKGHKWERVIRRRRKYQRILMRDMPERITKWRIRRVKRRPWPLSKPRVGSRKSQKLPF